MCGMLCRFRSDPERATSAPGPATPHRKSCRPAFLVLLSLWAQRKGSPRALQELFSIIFWAMAREGAISNEAIAELRRQGVIFKA